MSGTSDAIVSACVEDHAWSRRETRFPVPGKGPGESVEAWLDVPLRAGQTNDRGDERWHRLQ